MQTSLRIIATAIVLSLLAGASSAVAQHNDISRNFPGYSMRLEETRQARLAAERAAQAQQAAPARKAKKRKPD